MLVSGQGHAFDSRSSTTLSAANSMKRSDALPCSNPATSRVEWAIRWAATLCICAGALVCSQCGNKPKRARPTTQMFHSLLRTEDRERKVCGSSGVSICSQVVESRLVSRIRKDQLTAVVGPPYEEANNVSVWRAEWKPDEGTGPTCIVRIFFDKGDAVSKVCIGGSWRRTEWMILGSSNTTRPPIITDRWPSFKGAWSWEVFQKLWVNDRNAKQPLYSLV